MGAKKEGAEWPPQWVMVFYPKLISDLDLDIAGAVLSAFLGARGLGIAANDLTEVNVSRSCQSLNGAEAQEASLGSSIILLHSYFLLH